MPVSNELPEAATDALAAWLDHHDRLAPGLIVGLYVVGSLALDDWRQNSDIDIVAVLDHEPNDDAVEALRAAHDVMTSSVSRDIDGPRLVLSDLAAVPRALTRPWTLGGAFHHDNGCFELNPVTWRTLAQSGIVVRGTPVSQLDIADDGDVLRSFVRDNTASYWAPLADDIAAALRRDPDRDEFDATMLSWCVLGPARMLRTVESGDIVSKAEAGRWLVGRRAGHEPLIELALAARDRVDPDPVDRRTMEGLIVYLRDITALVAAS